MKTAFRYFDWGLIPYLEAWQKQESLFAEKLRRKSCGEISENYLFCCEHPHVYTLGKSGKESNLLIDSTQLYKRQAEFVRCNRGGDITYHGPGQLVFYPIFDLNCFAMGLKDYIHTLEELVIRSLAAYGISSGRMASASGVWVDPDGPAARKICAVGVRSSRYITMHGLALNVNTQLEYFDCINPCGFRDRGVTSMQLELGAPLRLDELKNTLRKAFEDSFRPASS